MPLGSLLPRGFLEPGAVGERPASTLKSRWCSVMTALFIAWIALTVVLVVLLIYRGTLTMHEDDQLFLDTAEDHMQKEQVELIGRMERLTPWVRVCGAGSALLLVAIAGLYLAQNLTR